MCDNFKSNFNLEDLLRIIKVIENKLPPVPSIDELKMELCAKLLGFSIYDLDSIRSSGITGVVKIYNKFFGFTKSDGYLYSYNGERYKPNGKFFDLVLGEKYSIPDSINLELELSRLHGEIVRRDLNMNTPLRLVP